MKLRKPRGLRFFRTIPNAFRNLPTGTLQISIPTRLSCAGDILLYRDQLSPSSNTSVMKHAFNIYPALFILTTVMQEETIQLSEQTCEKWRQTFWGDCLFNESHTQLVLRFESDMKVCPDQELFDGKLNVLQPAKFKGERYAITYIPVLN